MKSLSEKGWVEATTKELKKERRFDEGKEKGKGGRKPQDGIKPSLEERRKEMRTD